MMPLANYPWAEKYGWIEDKFGISWQLTFSERKGSITPSFFFCGSQQGKAEDAVKFYISKFPNSNIIMTARYEEGEPGPTGQIKFCSFTLDGQQFIAMDSGVTMDVPFTHGISMFINLETQDQVDYYWEGLAEGGHYDRCGWLQDKFGVSWQVLPANWIEMMNHPDKARTKKVIEKVFQMKKFDLATIDNAFNDY